MSPIIKKQSPNGWYAHATDTRGAIQLTIDELLQSHIFPTMDATIRFVKKQSTVDVPLFESLLPSYLEDWYRQSSVAIV